MAKNKPKFSPSDEAANTASQTEPTVQAQTQAAPTTEVQPAEQAATTPAPAPSVMPKAEGDKKDKRHVLLKDPETGEMVKRHDWIRKQVLAGKSRSEVTEEIRKITGDKDFRYQIVFQATKDIQNITPSARRPKPAPVAAATPEDQAAQPPANTGTGEGQSPGPEQLGESAPTTGEHEVPAVQL